MDALWNDIRAAVAHGPSPAPRRLGWLRAELLAETAKVVQKSGSPRLAAVIAARALLRYPLCVLDPKHMRSLVRIIRGRSADSQHPSISAPNNT
jgi:hypothetical protein